MAGRDPKTKGKTINRIKAFYDSVFSPGTYTADSVQRKIDVGNWPFKTALHARIFLDLLISEVSKEKLLEFMEKSSQTHESLRSEYYT